MISRSDFRPVTLRDREEIEAHYARHPQSHSENNFTTMVCWAHYAHYEFAFDGDALVIASTIAGRRQYRCPTGTPEPGLWECVLALAAQEECEYPFVIPGEENIGAFREFYPEIPLHYQRDFAEYVYRAKDLAELSGKRFQSIRRSLNRFRQRCDYRVEDVESGNIAEVEEFMIRWCDWKDCDSNPVLASEREALLFAIRHFAALGLCGLMIRVGGEIGAIALYEPMNRDTILVHFEKGLPDCEGIYKAINAETARRVALSFTYINRESDLGIEGLREAKERYHPDHMVPLCFVRREDLARFMR